MHQEYKLKEVIFILGITVTCLMLAVFYQISLTMGIIPGMTLLLISVFRKGYTKQQLFQAMKLAVKRNKEVAWLLAFVGMILPSWYLAGTIQDINDLFLSLISAEHFLLITFLITAVMSLVIGSSVGSLSIVGIPIMAAAHSIGISEAWVAGALVSGAFVGDRTSPLSSSFQLLTHSLELDPKRQLKVIIPTLILSVLGSIGIYMIFDMISPSSEFVASTTYKNLSSLSLVISFIPPALLMLAILIGAKMKQAFMVSIAAAFVILMFRGVPIQDWLTGIVSGTDGMGGVLHMVPFIVFIFVVGIYSQILEDAQMIQPYIDKVFTNETSLTVNTIQTVGVAGGISFISPNQSFPIILTGRSLLPHWKTHFQTDHLARILADSTVVFAGLIPWSLLAILCSTLLDVPVVEYLPFAVFLWVSPLITILFSLGTSLLSKQKVMAIKQHMGA